jgi:hypothetical protein
LLSIYNKRKRWLIINNQQAIKENEYKINQNVAYIQLSKKDGSTIDATIDTEDLKRVLEEGTWFAEWHKDFNNYLVQNIKNSIDDKNHSEKQTLQSFILGTHPKAPIRHRNGNTLDNRKDNLVVFDQNTINDYKEVDSETIAIILRDKYGKENGKALIDKEDYDKIVNSRYAWILYKLNSKPYAVANTPEGRIFLNRFIMDTPENMVTHPINLNTLDNRKCNLENVALGDD